MQSLVKGFMCKTNKKILKESQKKDSSITKTFKREREREIANQMPTLTCIPFSDNVVLSWFN